MNEKATQRDSSVVRHSFVVRIWRVGDGPKWQGWVQHARTGEEVYLRSLDDLLAFVEGQAGLPPRSDPAPGHLK